MIASWFRPAALRQPVSPYLAGATVFFCLRIIMSPAPVRRARPSAQDRANDDAREHARGEPVVVRCLVALVRLARQRGVGLEPRRHLLDLAVLHVDDVPRQVFAEMHGNVVCILGRPLPWPRET